MSRGPAFPVGERGGAHKIRALCASEASSASTLIWIFGTLVSVRTRAGASDECARNGRCAVAAVLRASDQDHPRQGPKAPQKADRGAPPAPKGRGGREVNNGQ